ncbi:protein cordon-bleu-like [Heterocephalus glaber]|uniref:Protein cordon-bleu-like n=1 Tax=Heterocephalus glaber TaxID=10181 RepID=A0AAX6QSW4_HETGA|nr:protein cordon-bleu-like [Heterocephalus glaber]
MEGSPGADGSAATQGRSGAWSPSAQGWAAGADAVPVTFIGEVSEEPGPEDCGLWPDQSNGAGPSDAGPGAAQRGAGAPGWREPGRRAPAPRAVPGPPSWCRRGQPAAGRCWREPGLTTYTIVPSHAERRPYARGASPPAGALRIDELGNLVGVPGARAAAPAAPGVDSEEQQPGKVREFWRRGPGAGSAQQAPSPSPAARAPPSPASAPAQPPPSAALARAPPLRPQRRTSSQHVAAAIARRIGAGPAGQRDDKARGPPGSPQPNGGPRLSSAVPGRASREEPATLRRGCGPQEEPCTLDLGTSTVPRAPHSPDPAHAPVPHRLPATGSAQAPTREPPSCPRVPGALEAEAQPCPAPAARHADCSLPTGIFGPKKKFRPVAQKPVRKDTCLHSALMDAIHAAGGKDKLRKTAEPPEERGPRTLSYTEADSERSALLAAIRGHSGTRSLRKVSSSASAELWGCWAAVPPEAPGPLPMPQAPPAPMTAPRTSSGPLGDAVDARQALLDAIRSGSGAARLKKP